MTRPPLHSLLSAAALLGLSLQLSSNALPAQTVTLTPERVLRVHFSIASPPSPTPDVIQLHLGIVQMLGAMTTRTARLYDCDQLLGTAQTSSFGGHVGALSMNPACSWRQVGSVWNFDNPGDVADFSSIQNATIRGLIEFTIATGAMDVDLGNVRVRIIRATSSSGGSVPGVQPVSIETVLGPRLDGPSPGTVGAVSTWTLQDGSPGNLVLHGFGFTCAPLLLPCVPPRLYDVVPQALLIGFVDGLGQSTASINVPPFAAGITLLAQSVELDATSPACRVSSLSVHTF